VTAERITSAVAELRALLDQIRTENGRIERENLFVRLGPLAERVGNLTIEELKQVSK